MELFSVECSTCRRRLRVQDLRAVGQILPCPKCGSLVAVTPPTGWQLPPLDLPETKVTGSITAGPVLTSDSGRVIVPPATPWADSPTEDDAIPAGDNATTAVGRGRLAAFAALAAVVLLGAAGMYLWRAPSRPAAQANADDGQQNVGSATTDANEGPSPPTTVATIETASDPPRKDDSPLATSEPDELPDKLSIAEIATGEPITTETESAEAATTKTPETPDAAPPDTASPDDVPAIAASPDEATEGGLATVTSSPRPADFLRRQPLPEVDAETQLSQIVAGFQVDGRPLCEFVLSVARFAGCPVLIDVDALRQAGLSVDLPVQIHEDNATYAEVLRSAVAPLGLVVLVQSDHALVTVRQAADQRDESQTISLTPAWAERAEALAESIPRLVAPTTWQSTGGTGSVVASQGTLRIEQLPKVQRQVVALLVELGAAEGQPSNHDARRDAPTWQMAEELLATPVSSNFRPAAPLAAVLRRLVAQANVQVVYDLLAMARGGVTDQELIELSALDDALGETLDAGLGPTGLTYRVIDGHTLEITSWLAASQQAEPFVFSIGQDTPPAAALAQARRALDQLGVELTTEMPGVDQAAMAFEIIAAGERVFLVVRAPLAAVVRLAQTVAKSSDSPTTHSAEEAAVEEQAAP